MSVKIPLGIIVLLAASVARAQPPEETPPDEAPEEPSEAEPEAEPEAESEAEPEAGPEPSPEPEPPPFPAATEPPAVDPVQPQRAVPPPLPEPDDRFSMKVWASGGVRAIADTPVYIFEGDLAFGRRLRSKPWYFYGVVGASGGETDLGLGVYRWWLGASIEHEWDIVRLGVMPQISMLIVTRMTNADALAAACIGADGTFSIDLVRGEQHHALFFALRAGAAFIFPEAAYWGSTAGLGYRY